MFKVLLIYARDSDKAQVSALTRLLEGRPGIDKVYQVEAAELRLLLDRAGEFAPSDTCVFLLTEVNGKLSIVQFEAGVQLSKQTPPHLADEIYQFIVQKAKVIAPQSVYKELLELYFSSV